MAHVAATTWTDEADGGLIWGCRVMSQDTWGTTRRNKTPGHIFICLGVNWLGTLPWLTVKRSKILFICLWPDALWFSNFYFYSKHSYNKRKGKTSRKKNPVMTKESLVSCNTLRDTLSCIPPCTRPQPIGHHLHCARCIPINSQMRLSISESLCVWSAVRDRRDGIM